MSARLHRTLVAVLSSLTGISALLAATDPQKLGVGAAAWAWIALALAAGNVVVTAARQAFDR